MDGRTVAPTAYSRIDSAAVAAVPQRRRTQIIELFVCAALVGALAVYGLYRMDYLSAATAHHIRMTDATRTAYVAKNIAEGRGYTTNELPAYLVDFYDQKGKLHQDNWPNADRFPFTAYAVAALYIATGSTSVEVGILGYNLACFIGFLVLLYWLTRTIWNDRWAALLAVCIALLHPLTYVYLYLKDADMMLLTLGVMTAFWLDLSRPDKRMSWKLALFTGTILGWLYLARPNIGLGFVLYFGLRVIGRLWRGRKQLVPTIKDVLRHEGIVAGVFIAWCLPYIIHSMSEWGSPFFSANAIYQLPLGTNYAMDTDTWWKYSEPGHLVTVRSLLEDAPHQLLAKFTTSWVATLKVVMASYAIELILAIGLFAVLFGGGVAATSSEPERARTTAVKQLASAVGLTVLVNFAMLPLYGYQNYGYRHYLSFMMPLLWVGSGKAMVMLGERIRPIGARLLAWIRENPGLVLSALVVAVLAWNFGTKAQETNTMFARTGAFVGSHWLSCAVLLGVVLFRRFVFRAPAFPRAVLVVAALVFARYQPYFETKRLNLNWFPADTKVWDVLRQRKGLVMSLAMQSEVNWASDRKNIPAPELPMHAYSLLFDHKLEVEDIYLESPEAMLSSFDGVFYYAAPGFESYLRLDKYQGRIPGYEIVFHSATSKGYPKFNVKPRAKSSTVYRLVDRTAVAAMAKSPDHLELGKVDDIIYTAYGWGDYFVLDGKPAVAATDLTRIRYQNTKTMGAYEDSSATFFLDDRRPKSVDFQIYATQLTTLQFYWNLDLYAYDDADDRPKHGIGTYKIDHLGWQTVHLEVPAKVTRKGINKLGFRASAFQSLAVCPTEWSDAQCTQLRPQSEPAATALEPLPSMTLLRDGHVTTATPMRASLFAGTLDFHY